jgi:NAD(P)-dependent dehydrogenase (short-subunit alcohol dehydrogenase family)
MQAFPVGRMGRPEELVAASMYLCSDDARFCTGTTLILDGGFTAQGGYAPVARVPHAA